MNDYYCTECDPCKGHAGLGVGHIWTNVQCPAYRTQLGSDCKCSLPVLPIRRGVA